MTNNHDNSELHPETRAIRAGRADNDTALAPILWATTTFVTPTVAEAREMATGVGSSRFYGRYGNPTVAGFEDAICRPSARGIQTARPGFLLLVSPAWRGRRR